MDGGWCFPGCCQALGQGTPARLHRETDGDSPMGCVVRAGQTRPGRLAPGRTASWSAGQPGAVCRMGHSGGPRPPSLRCPLRPSPGVLPPSRNEGCGRRRTTSPSDPTQPQDQGCKALAAHETVQRGSGPPTNQQPQRAPFTPHLQPQPRPSVAESWQASGGIQRAAGEPTWEQRKVRCVAMQADPLGPSPGPSAPSCITSSKILPFPSLDFSICKMG